MISISTTYSSRDGRPEFSVGLAGTVPVNVAQMMVLSIGWGLVLRMKNFFTRALRRLKFRSPVPAFNATDTSNALDFLNLRPMPPSAFRLLFIGDSLMMHGVSKGLWDVACGMAATKPENDFVHLITRRMQELIGLPIEILCNNGGDGRLFSMLSYARRTELFPHLIILQGGENDQFDRYFREAYEALLDFYPVPTVVLGDWWSAEKSQFERWMAERRHYPFISLNDIRGPRTTGYCGPYDVIGVGEHPNDEGMAQIAAAVVDAIVSNAILVQAMANCKEGPTTQSRYPSR